MAPHASRTPTVGGNWKMNLHRGEAIKLAEALSEYRFDPQHLDVTVFPALPYMAAVAQAFCERGCEIKVGAQDVYPRPNGAFTGEVSLSMLKDIGVRVVLVGHSERRHVLGETDTQVNEKLLAALEAGYELVLAVGETLEQRENGQTDAVNAAQTLYGLAGVHAEQMSRVTLAYEPVWAIGTGKTATPEDAQSAQQRIRQTVAALFDDAVAQALRIQYGGSVKPANAAELFSQPDIDGGLIGGASLKADDFKAILDAAVQTSST